jgi:hypothetical protein
MHFWIKFEQPVPYDYKLNVRLRTRPGRFDPDDVDAGTDRGAYYEFSTEDKRGGAEWERMSIPLSTFNKGSGDPTIRDIRQIEITTSAQEGHQQADAKATFTYVDGLCFEETVDGRMEEKTIQVRFLAPLLHNCMFAAAPVSEVKFVYRLKGVNPDRCTLKAKLTSAAGTDRISESEITPKKEGVVALKAPPFSPGSEWIMSYELSDKKDHRVLQAGSEPLRMLPRKKGEVTIREDGILLADGRPFYPRGMFRVPAEEFAAARDLGMNVVGFYIGLWEDPYLEYLDAAEQFGLKVVVMITLKAPLQEHIPKIMNHPALLGYLTSDEPSPRKFAPLYRNYKTITAIDPYHPVMILTDEFPDAPFLFRDACDIANPNLYALPGKLERVISKTEKNVAAMKGIGTSWFTSQAVPQMIFGRGTYTEKPSPTFDELRAATWLPLVHGAQGITPYIYNGYASIGDDGAFQGRLRGLYLPIAFPNLWTKFKYVMKELSALEAMLIAPDFDGVVEVEPDFLSTRVKRSGKHLYVTALNWSEDSQSATFSIPELKNETLFVVSEARTIALAKGSFADEFLPRETHIYTTDPDCTALDRTTLEIRRATNREERERFERSRKNRALKDNGARLDASWGGFPPREGLGKGAWHSIHDGFYGTYWAPGQGSERVTRIMREFLEERDQPEDAHLAGRRWIDIKFAEPAAIGLINVVTAELEYELNLFKGEEFIRLDQDEETVLEDFYPEHRAVKRSFTGNGLEADGVRIILPRDANGNEIIYEVEAY